MMSSRLLTLKERLRCCSNCDLNNSRAPRNATPKTTSTTECKLQPEVLEDDFVLTWPSFDLFDDDVGVMSDENDVGVASVDRFHNDARRSLQFECRHQRNELRARHDDVTIDNPGAAVVEVARDEDAAVDDEREERK